MNIDYSDYSDPGDACVFTVAEFINGDFVITEITRKEYFIAMIKEQPFF